MPTFRTPNGQTVEVSDFQLAQNPKLAEGLTPVTTGGVSQGILTGVETGAATVANLGSAVSQFAGDVDAMGNPVETVSPVAPESLVPGAFTPEALQRREDNPGYALAGTIAAEAPTLLIPGVSEGGWAARLGVAAARGLASGAIAEAGQDALTGEQFSAKHAAFYGLVGESLGALASAGLGRLVRMTGKAAPSALELAAMKASRADMADALGEPAESALKVSKMAENAPALVDQAVTDLGEHLDTVQAKLSSAEEKAFSPASIKRNVSANQVAQSENLMSRGIELEEAAKRLASDGLESVPAPELPTTQMGTPLDYRPPTAAETQSEASKRVLGEIRRKLGSENIDAVNEAQVGVRGRKGMGTRSSAGQQARIDAMSPEERLTFRSNLEEQAAIARRTPFHGPSEPGAPSLYRRMVESSGSFPDKIQAAVDEMLAQRSSADMYATARRLSGELHAAAPEGLPDYAQAALGKLDDSLADESTWGNVAKLAADSKASQAARGGFSADVLGDAAAKRAKLAGLFEDGADRTQLNAYLDSAEAAAKASTDKGLRKAVESARAALAAGDDASTSRLIHEAFSPPVPDAPIPPTPSAHPLAGRIARKVLHGVISAGLGAVGLHGGIAGGVAGMALGEAVAPFAEQAAARFTTESVAPVLRKLSQSATTALDTAGRSLSNGTLRASMSTIGTLGAPTMSAGVASFMGSSDSVRSAYNDKLDVLNQIQRDPTLLVEELNDSIGALAVTHPELHAEIIAKHYQAIAFVQSKVPETVGASISSPSGVPASNLAIRSFALYYSGATDPSSVVTDVRNNRVRQEQIEALKAVWPEVYADLKASTLKGMSMSKPTVQQRMRMDLLFDFGPALDAGLSWSLALVMDARTGQDAQAMAARAKSAPRGRSTPSIAAQQPQGLAALANPQTEQV